MALLLLKRDTVSLLRIPFSLYLMPVFLLSLSQTEIINAPSAFISFLIIHLLVYPASNGYNSYIDRDESSIGGLEKPPLPTRELFYTTVFLDILSVVISLLLVNDVFALCIVLYIAASRAYSSKQIRLKKYPYAGFLTVIFFQGAFTYYMSHAGISGIPLSLNKTTMFVLLAATFQIAGAYPLTQVYQHKEDRNSGIKTLSMVLGITGTFMFTTIMFILCNVFYYLYFSDKQQLQLFVYLQLFFLPVISFFLYWFYRTFKNPREASFKNAMRMNMVASACSASCFLFFTLLKL